MGDPSDKHVTHFFDLPAELRIKIYRYVMLDEGSGSGSGSGPGANSVDLDPANHIRLAPRLAIFQVSQRVHSEAYPIFYGNSTFAVFPQHGRFFYHQRPLLMQLPSHYLARITSLHLTLGQGWSKIPKSWHDLAALGLGECKSLRKLYILVRCDSSARFFDGFRGPGKDASWYTNFCVALLDEILSSTPWLVDFEIEAFPGITKHSLLVKTLSDLLIGRGKRVGWGPEISIGEEKVQAPTALSDHLDALVGQMNAMHLAARQSLA